MYDDYLVTEEMKGIIISKIVYVFFLSGIISGCHGQTKNEKMTNEKSKNPLLCDTTTGVCGTADDQMATGNAIADMKGEKPVKVIYFTDPICSSCWGIEPQLRKLKQEYGNSIEVEYRMGGLLPDWSYNSGGISKPSDVTSHWDEASRYYDMPIDGDVWLEDPLNSSYPPSIAFKAAQMQDEQKAIQFLRDIREMVFLEKKNICKIEHIVAAGKKAGLDTEQLKADINNGKAKALFEDDLKLAREMGVRGFPTMFFTDHNGSKEIVYGSKPYPFYETSVLKLHSKAEKKEYDKEWGALFSKYTSLTAKEFSELSGTNRKESEKLLNELTEKGSLAKITTKNGSIWSLKK